MENLVDVKEWRFAALTDIWTGNVNQQNDRLITTGLLGSIRWWFEVVVRGLSGSACDPTGSSKVRCPDDGKKPTESGHHCVVCELFGCTGWARKFRFEVVDEASQPITNAIQKGQQFILRFIPLRSIRGEEWALLDITLRLIAEYGAIGGKTVLKPSEAVSKRHHQDYGIIKLEKSPFSPPKFANSKKETLAQYVRGEGPWQARWRRVDHNDFAWASLEHFWCVKGKYLSRKNAEESTFNRVIGRPEPKNQSNQNDSWLAGYRPSRTQNREAESKKVFSFKAPEEARRTFGYIKPKEIGFDEIKKRLQNVWGSDFKDEDFLTGEQVIEKLLDDLSGGGQ